MLEVQLLLLLERQVLRRLFFISREVKLDVVCDSFGFIMMGFWGGVACCMYGFVDMTLLDCTHT